MTEAHLFESNGPNVCWKCGESYGRGNLHLSAAIVAVPHRVRCAWTVVSAEGLGDLRMTDAQICELLQQHCRGLSNVSQWDIGGLKMELYRFGQRISAETQRLKTEPAGDSSPVAAPAPRAEEFAKRFHNTYERLAPMFGYVTRGESAVPWEYVPKKNRELMIATCAELLNSSPPQLGPTVERGQTPVRDFAFVEEIAAIAEKEAQKTDGYGSGALINFALYIKAKYAYLTLAEREKAPLAAERVTQAQWIPVSERLPEYGSVFMVYGFDKNDLAPTDGRPKPYMDMATYSYHGGFHVGESGNTNYYVTHWRELPTPPAAQSLALRQPVKGG